MADVAVQHLTAEQLDQVVGAVERQLVENEGQRITTALRLGIITFLLRTVPTAPVGDATSAEMAAALAAAHPTESA